MESEHKPSGISGGTCQKALYQGSQTQFLEAAALQSLVPTLLQHTNHVVFK